MMNFIKSVCPATLELIGEVPETDPNSIPDIVSKAKTIQKEWAKTKINERKKLLKKLLKYCSENIDEIAKVIHMETGKPRMEAINSEVVAGMGITRFSIDVLRKVLKPKKIKLTGMKWPMMAMSRHSYISPKPVGVVGIISPWNFPFAIPFDGVVMAIAVGNSVVLKPSSSTVLTGIKIKEVIEKVGFPKDLVQVIIGSGNTVGNALARSEVDRIIFTGSVSVGKEIMSIASQRLTPVVLELGDKSPMIVFKDTTLERAVNGGLWNSFINLGQACAGIKRIYVQEEIYDLFVSSYFAKMKKLKQGWNWDDPDIDIGPLINKAALEKMQRFVAKAKEDGAIILTGGQKSDLKGYFFEPTIILNAKQSDYAVQEEIFGPIVCILKFKTEEEAIKLANDTKFGLFGSVWTNFPRKGKRVAEQLTMGTACVNNHTYTFGLPQLPWGGNKESGFGRTHGLMGFQELLENHHVHYDNSLIRREPWWFPYNKAKLRVQYLILNILILRKYWRALPIITKWRVMMGPEKGKANRKQDSSGKKE